MVIIITAFFNQKKGTLTYSKHVLKNKYLRTQHFPTPRWENKSLGNTTMANVQTGEYRNTSLEKKTEDLTFAKFLPNQ